MDLEPGGVKSLLPNVGVVDRLFERPLVASLSEEVERLDFLGGTDLKRVGNATLGVGVNGTTFIAEKTTGSSGPKLLFAKLAFVKLPLEKLPLPKLLSPVLPVGAALGPSGALVGAVILPAGAIMAYANVGD
ncbi:hypothetical protein [Granulicella paludicola]|uniref:hypothetical protein n=1 Tax=Granulicella paludicola TaxID=474951 RepID=UPI0021E00130|nr:hypothetical protein [Granulicella paludicola]